MGNSSDREISDALVLFGVTGDLAYKMIFPALYAMAKQGSLNVPVIGVASTQWSLEQLRQRAMDSIQKSGTIDDRHILDHLFSLLRYVAGDYNDAGTFKALKQVLGDAKRPGHSAFAVCNCYQKSRGCRIGRACAHHYRKAFRPRSGLGEGVEPHRAIGVSPGCDLPHRSLPWQGSDHEHSLFPLRQFVPGADLEPQLRGQHSGHFG